jgi:predicted flap endonuclease-1-like 5' DNA nuclease
MKAGHQPTTKTTTKKAPTRTRKAAAPQAKADGATSTGSSAAGNGAAGVRMAAWASGSWKKGTTKLGTPGAGHVDDLKVINGIGPKMEGLLKSFGIQTWEQVAALTDTEIDTVDAALEEFPGRIRRDDWVPQAQAIMKAGHQPTTKTTTKKAPTRTRKAAAPRGAKAWQDGVTRLGTPGARHRDDLKVVNGIGPKMESILNDFGIQAWEQLAAFTKADVAKVSDAIDTFPGRIERDEWVSQAKDLVKEFPDTGNRPTRATYLNRSADTDPWN